MPTTPAPRATEQPAFAVEPTTEPTPTPEPISESIPFVFGVVEMTLPSEPVFLEETVITNASGSTAGVTAHRLEMSGGTLLLLSFAPESNGGLKEEYGRAYDEAIDAAIQSNFGGEFMSESGYDASMPAPNGERVISISEGTCSGDPAQIFFCWAESSAELSAVFHVFPRQSEAEEIFSAMRYFK